MPLTALIAAAAVAASAGEPAKPAIFAPGEVSAPVRGTAPTFMPDARTVIYERDTGEVRDLVQSRLTDKGWTPPAALPFPPPWSYLEPALSADGSYLLFASNRPPAGGEAPLDGRWNGKTLPGRGGAIWRSDRTASGWSAPRPLPAVINEGGSVFEPALAADGTLYFMRPHDGGKFQLLRAQARDGGYEAPEPLPFRLDGIADVDPAVAADDSYLIFASARQTSGKLGLFVSFHDKAGGWSEPVAFPAEINAPGSIVEPHISPDGQTLYYTRDLVIWSVALPPILERLRPKDWVRAR